MEKHLKYYQSKQSVNLVMRERTRLPKVQTVPLLVLVVVVALAFGKFAVADRLIGAASIERRAEQAEAQLTALQSYNADFEAVRAEYNRYFSSVDDGTVVVADALGVLDIVESYLMATGTVSAVNFTGGAMDVDLHGVDLDGAADLIGRLSALPAVGSVGLSRADSEGVSSTHGQAALRMTITFVGGGAA